MIKFIKDDGGRDAAGFKGSTGDCVTRAISIAAGLPYTIVYDRLAEGNASQRITKHTRNHRMCGVRSAANGVWVKRKWFKDYMAELGFTWVSTMSIGSGCKVHLRDDELPLGRVVVALSKHMAAVINGVLHDTYDCSREGTRCVYGYYEFKGNKHV